MLRDTEENTVRMLGSRMGLIWRWLLLISLSMLGLLALKVSVAGQTNSPSNTAPTNAPAQEPQPTEGQSVAATFLTSCAGCHSLTGEKLIGPDLNAARQWPLDQLKAAIKRMQANVGPLSEEKITDLAQFLKSPDVLARLKAENERIAAKFMAQLEPASAALGRNIFEGRVPLTNGGLSCVSCHMTEGRGGKLGLPLNGVFTKLGGELPLVSAIEQAKFKIMDAHYQRHPITRQEAVHLAKYFSTLDPQDTRVPSPRFAGFGAAGAGVVFLGITLVLKHQRRLRRDRIRLQRRRK